LSQVNRISSRSVRNNSSTLCHEVRLDGLIKASNNN
jgi:hypothetical protein